MRHIAHRRSAAWVGQLVYCQYAKYLVFLTCVLMAATALPVDGDAENTSHTMNKYRLPDSVVPTHYDIKLILHIDDGNSSLDGESSITVQVRRPTNTLYLHTKDLTIDEAVTKVVDSNGDSYVPTTHNHDNVTEILIIDFENDLSPGKYILHLNYGGIFQEKKEQMASTRFKPTSARRVFPCWDEPALKASFNISIKHNRNDTALSNMPIREQTDDGTDNDTVWTHFETSPIMSTYQVGFMVLSDFTNTSNEDGTITTWWKSNDPRAPVKYEQDLAVQFAQLLTEYTNTTVKVPKIDQVVSQQPAIVKEDWGLILNNGYLSEESASIYYSYQSIEVAARTIAHQWFGNIVSPSWWSHMWLTEGLAAYFADYVIDKTFDDMRKTELFVIDSHYTIMDEYPERIENLKPLTEDVNTSKEISDFLDNLDRYKARTVLRMLQHILTDDVFRKGIIIYLNAHQFGSVTSDDFWSAMQEALDESEVPHDNYNVKEVMDTWIKQSYYPVVHVTRNYENGDVILTQKPFRPRNKADSVNDEKWWIPITFATRSNPDFSNTLPSHWLRPQDETIVIKGIDLDDWIIVNVQKTGYYRVEYDFPSWYKIAEYLNSDDYEKIHVLNRAQILDDFFHLMTYPSDLIRFKELANYLQRETDFIAWMPIIEFVKNKEDFDNFPDTHSVKIHLVKLMDTLVKHVGPDDNPGDSVFKRLTRLLTMSSGCEFGNSECDKILREFLMKEGERIDFNKLPRNKLTWVFGASWTPCEKQICKMNKCNNECDDSESTVLKNTWHSSNSSINILSRSVIDDILPDDKYSTIYNTIVQKHADNDSVLDYLLANISKTTSRGYTTEQILEKIINNVHSTERLEKISNFVKDNFDNETTVEQAITAINKRKAEQKQ